VTPEDAAHTIAAQLEAQRQLLSDILAELVEPHHTIRFFETAAVAANAMEIDLEALPPNFVWLIERTSYFCNSTTQTEATLYVDAIDPRNMVDYTNVGNKSIGDQAQPILIPTGSRLVAQWTGVTAPANPIAKLRVQYRAEPLQIFREVPATIRELVGAHR
jgi:hypothetical protein